VKWPYQSEATADIEVQAAIVLPVNFGQCILPPFLYLERNMCISSYREDIFRGQEFLSL
jgi:hypothetical protein